MIAVILPDFFLLLLSLLLHNTHSRKDS